jgi:hypothetical protein
VADGEHASVNGMQRAAVDSNADHHRRRTEGTKVGEGDEPVLRLGRRADQPVDFALFSNLRSTDARHVPEIGRPGRADLRRDGLNV